MLTISNHRIAEAARRHWRVPLTASQADPKVMPAQVAHPQAHTLALGQLPTSMTLADVMPDDQASADASLAMFVNSRLAMQNCVRMQVKSIRQLGTWLKRIRL